MIKKHIKPIHPGIYLKELLAELALSQYRLAHDLGVPAMRINYVVNGKRPVNAELALRLGRYFGQGPLYWINLQSHYDMDTAEDTLADQVTREVQPLRNPRISMTPLTTISVEPRLREFDPRLDQQRI